MCMTSLDNTGDSRAATSKLLGKIVYLLFSGIVAVDLVGCHKTTVLPPRTESATDSIRDADHLYSEREDLLKVRQAIVILRQAQAVDPSNYEIAWRLAEYNYDLGSSTTNDAEKAKAFQDGIEAGKLAVKLIDNRPEGHFWLGANYGGEAEINTLAGLAAIDDIKTEMDRVLKIDEHYEAGSAYMVLGQVYLEAPKMFGGDSAKAIEFFEKGLKVGPNNATLHLHLAKAYFAANRKEDARKQIDELFAMKPTAGYEPEYNQAIAEAKKLREKL